MKERIQLFKPIYSYSTLTEIQKCLDKGWTGLGYKTEEFEERFKDYTDLPHAHFLNSATSGLELALRLVKRHKEIDQGPYVTPRLIASTPMTFVATNHAVVNVNGIGPYFMDIDPYSLNMNPMKVRDHLLDKNLDALIFVGMGGNNQHLDEIVTICEQNHIKLILDASHMCGSFDISGKHVGYQADYTIFSFQAVKNLSTGDGGMICCKDEQDDFLARKLAWLGIDKDTWSRTKEGKNWSYNVPFIGHKYHGNSIAAAIGIEGLKILESANAIRRMIRKSYNKGLNFGYEKILHQEGTSSHLYQVCVPAQYRDRIINYARSKGVELGVHYISNTEYPMYKYGKESTPEATARGNQLISLPMGPHLREIDIDRVIEVMNDGFDLAEKCN